MLNLLLCAAFAMVPASDAVRPHIIVILADDLVSYHLFQVCSFLIVLIFGTLHGKRHQGMGENERAYREIPSVFIASHVFFSAHDNVRSSQF